MCALVGRARQHSVPDCAHCVVEETWKVKQTQRATPLAPPPRFTRTPGSFYESHARPVFSSLGNSRTLNVPCVVVSCCVPHATIICFLRADTVASRGFVRSPKIGRAVVLVGDPAQLPATILSQEAKDANYGQSLFQRLQRGGHPKMMLDTQYRMHPSIASFASGRFYNGLLR